MVTEVIFPIVIPWIIYEFFNSSQFSSYNLFNSQNKPGSAGVLRLMEMFALQAARRLPREDMADPAITNNISELQSMILLRFSVEAFLCQMSAMAIDMLAWIRPTRSVGKQMT